MSIRRSIPSLILFLVAILVTSSALYLLFDNFLKTTSEEIVKAWYYGEIINLQEGQILPAISKNQNLFSRSPYIRAVVLIDRNDPERPLFSVGELSSKNLSEKIVQAGRNNNNIVSLRLGFLSRNVVAKLPVKNDLIIVYEFSSTVLIWSYLLSVAVGILSVLYLFIFAKRIAKREEENKEKIRRDIVGRLSHDLNSPLLMLSSLSLQAKSIDFQLHQKLEAVAGNIRRIFNQTERLEKQLERESQDNPTAIDKETSLVPLAAVVTELVNQKRAEFSLISQVDLQLEIAPQAAPVFVNINKDEFIRHISNILVNAVEATKDSSSPTIKVALALDRSDSQVLLRFTDNGCGISDEVISKIGTKGFSHGKKNGNGLGLYYAVETVKLWNGKFKISSRLEEGTEIEMALPKVATPNWFCNEIMISPDSKIVIVDDDPSIPLLWEKKLKLKPGQYFYFNLSSSFKKWFAQTGQFEDSLLFLFDYQIDSDGNGISLISEFGIQRESILITSAYNDECFISSLKQSRMDCVKVLPKALIEQVTVKNLFIKSSGNDNEYISISIKEDAY